MSKLSLPEPTSTQSKLKPHSPVKAAAALGHVQVSDSNRFQPGAGHLDWSALLGTLDAIGYDGYLALECRLRGEPAVAVAAVPGFLRRHDVSGPA